MLPLSGAISRPPHTLPPACPIPPQDPVSVTERDKPHLRFLRDEKGTTYNLRDHPTRHLTSDTTQSHPVRTRGVSTSDCNQPPLSENHLKLIESLQLIPSLFIRTTSTTPSPPAQTERKHDEKKRETTLDAVPKTSVSTDHTKRAARIVSLVTHGFLRKAFYTLTQTPLATLNATNIHKLEQLHPARSDPRPLPTPPAGTPYLTVKPDLLKSALDDICTGTAPTVSGLTPYMRDEFG